ncbi:MAG: hypothetical protein IT260_09945 [Saprospiraceae bacterium]|nr:hypothetical protein [Saprospiraceae bacterium]
MTNARVVSKCCSAWSAVLFLFCAAAPARAQVVSVVSNESYADFTVFLVSNEAYADLLVYKESSPNFASGNKGWWYFEKTPSFAKKKIFFASNEAFADLKIYYVSSSNFAGWKNPKKKALLD